MSINPERLSWFASDCVENELPLPVSFKTVKKDKTIEIEFRRKIVYGLDTGSLTEEQIERIEEIVNDRFVLNVKFVEQHKVNGSIMVTFSVDESKRKPKAVEKKEEPRDESTEIEEPDGDGNVWIIEDRKYILGISLQSKEEEKKLVYSLDKSLDEVDFDKLHVLSDDCKMTSGCRFPSFKAFVSKSGSRTIILTLCKYHPSRIEFTELSKKEIREKLSKASR